MASTDLLSNGYAPSGQLRAIVAGTSLYIPAPYFVVLQDISNGNFYGLYISNGVVNTVLLDSNFNPAETQTT